MNTHFDLVVDEQSKLILKRPGEEDAKDVRIRRAFPWSQPDRYVSIRSSEGKELMLIDDVSALDSRIQKIIADYLAGSVFIPQITRIEAIDDRFGFQDWSVQTDRGPIHFRVQEREDIRFLPDGRFSVKDADGNVYELPPLRELGEHTRRALERVI